MNPADFTFKVKIKKEKNACQNYNNADRFDRCYYTA